MMTLLIRIGVRLLGFGLTAVGAWVANKYGLEAGAAVSTAGGIVLHEVQSIRAIRAEAGK